LRQWHSRVIATALPGIYLAAGRMRHAVPALPSAAEVAMNLHRVRTALIALAVVACFAPSPQASACSEGLFNSGKGLAFQGYLAPRPALVLIYSPSPSAQGDDAAGLAAALAANHYDVVITGLEDVDAVAASASGPRVLPVVARAQRSSPQVRDRFAVFVVDGASLGQYLRGINRLLPPNGR
jgi:hypothetical protein